jgi:tetratricopeptide (TPR) repeat protein
MTKQLFLTISWFLLFSNCASAEAQSSEPATAAALGQEKNLSLQETYLAEAATHGAARWTGARLPIKYHIEEKPLLQGYKPGLKLAVERAMQAWTVASQGKVSFSPAETSQAALLITWTNDSQKMNFAQELGHAEVICDGQGIAKANILLLTAPNGKGSMSDVWAEHAALHELGHSLGILGHSPDSTDVMYPTTTETESARLSNRDANTICALYSSKGDQYVRNIDLLKLTDYGNGASPALQAARLNVEASEALKSMQFAVAIQKLEQAHQMDPSSQVIISNLGGTYANVASLAAMMHKPQDAERYFKKAIDLLGKSKNQEALLPILSNYSTFLKSTGRVDDGNKIDAQIRASGGGN